VGEFWYIKLILTFYIFYPAIIAYYEVIKDLSGIYTPITLYLFLLIMYLFGLFIPSFKLVLYSDPTFRYLIYFLLGIYINDNYNLIYQHLEKISITKVILLSGLILSLPFISMFNVVDERCSTQFSNLIPYYHQLALISTQILHICIFILCLHLLLVYKPNIKILDKIGEYSYGIFIIHPLFLNFLAVCIFPRSSISPTSLNFYIILFTSMLTMSYFTVKLMLSYGFTTYMITGKNHSALK
jgi:peptidoglycan/LPS O-acetylase OafA/YrhL